MTTKSEIQFDTVTRLTALRQIATDLNERSRRRAQEVRDVAGNLSNAKRRLADLRAAPQGFTIPPSQPADRDGIARRLPLDAAPTAPQRAWAPGDLASAISAAEGRVRDLEAALETAKFEEANSAGRWTAASRLYDACLKFAQDHDLPLPAPVFQTGPDRHAGQATHGEVR